MRHRIPIWQTPLDRFSLTFKAVSSILLPCFHAEMALFSLSRGLHEPEAAIFSLRQGLPSSLLREPQGYAGQDGLTGCVNPPKADNFGDFLFQPSRREAQSLDLLDLAKNCSFLNWKLELMPIVEGFHFWMGTNLHFSGLHPFTWLQKGRVYA